MKVRIKNIQMCYSGKLGGKKEAYRVLGVTNRRVVYNECNNPKQKRLIVTDMYSGSKLK